MDIKKRILKNKLFQKFYFFKKPKSIGIYNRYWNVKGGGESHALSFANILKDNGVVYLISEKDFSIDELSNYFHIDLKNCKKVIQPDIDEEFTEKFDIFINSTYRSNLNSLAKRSYYIVSFPDKNIDKNLLRNYTFLYNSEYTKKWAIAYWGNNHRSELIKPLGMLKKNDYENMCLENKSKYILSVGRFFRGGHSKNQHIIAQVFKKLNQTRDDIDDWKLILIGSLNKNNIENIHYLEQIKKELEGLNFEIIINAEQEILYKYYKESYMYIHASGYGNDSENAPEKFEHFGITVVEAMIHGCYPIVYSIGGPKEILKKINIGSVFDTTDDLENVILRYTQKYEISNIELGRNVSNAIVPFINTNYPDEKIGKII